MGELAADLNHLVVARYQEDAAWCKHVDGWNVIVVQKGRDLPNEGREPSSFFWALARLYDTLEDTDTVACVQGNPFQHCPQLAAALTLPVDRFRALGEWRVITDLEGRPHHEGLPVERFWSLWLRSEPEPLWEFAAGGQFAVTGAAVLSRPKKFYSRMVGHMSQQHAPWVMERLWERLFTEDA